jgi:hypothetical protein
MATTALRVDPGRFGTGDSQDIQTDEITPVVCFVEPPVPVPVTPNPHPQHNFDS